MSNVDDVLTQFTKKELLEISKELGMYWSTDDQKVDMINKMIVIGTHLANSDSDVELSEQTIEFLVTAEVIGEDGTPLKEVNELPERLPQCFGFADNSDPSCQKCVVYGACQGTRLSKRPACFGLEYQSTAPECVVCFEAAFCKLHLENKKQKEQ